MTSSRRGWSVGQRFLWLPPEHGYQPVAEGQWIERLGDHPHRPQFDEVL